MPREGGREPFAAGHSFRVCAVVARVSIRCGAVVFATPPTPKACLAPRFADQYLPVVNRQAARAELNGNFDLLRHVIAEEQADCRIRPGFPLDRLAERENFLSLMHFFGLLSIRSVAEGIPRLGIPNQTVKQLMYGYLRDAWRDAEAFTVDLYALERMMYAMAYRGAWRPVLELLADAVARQTGIRDYIAGEKVLHGFLAACMGIADCFLFRSERELNGGCADICLEPFLAGHPQMRHGYLIELKYLERGAGNEQAVEAAARQAGAQLRGGGGRPPPAPA